MKLGILSAIHPETSQVDWGGSPIDAYIRFLQRAGAEFDFSGYAAAQGELPTNVRACDAYLITGSPSGVYESDPWISALRDFVRDAFAAERKLVGICFGHQMLAHALGGEVVLAEGGWGLGPRTLTVSQIRPWMSQVRDEVALYFSHQDQVIRLPEGATLLGGDTFCPIGFYEIGSQVLAVQGHPEFDARIMDGILGRMEGRVEPERLADAREALAAHDTDGDLVGRWLVRFLSGPA
jgi:GMP synthase-like glutamine amidotransferase